MKKVISLIIMFMLLTTISINVLAANSVLDDEAPTIITGNEYENAQGNEQNDDTKLPQTGVEDYGIGILLVMCITTAMFAYKKISDYKGI